MKKKLSKKEETHLIDLLKKTPNLPDVPHKVFEALIKKSPSLVVEVVVSKNKGKDFVLLWREDSYFCLLYTSPSPRDPE